MHTVAARGGRPTPASVVPLVPTRAFAVRVLSYSRDVRLATAGGLCPGLNDVIRQIVLTLDGGYGVTNITGAQNVAWKHPTLCRTNNLWDH